MTQTNRASSAAAINESDFTLTFFEKWDWLRSWAAKIHQLQGKSSDDDCAMKRRMRKLFGRRTRYVAVTNRTQLVAVATVIPVETTHASFLLIEEVAICKRYRHLPVVRKLLIGAVVRFAKTYGRSASSIRIIHAAPLEEADREIYSGFGFQLLATGDTNLYQLDLK